MDIFFGSTAQFIHNILPTTTTPAKTTTTRQPASNQSSGIDFSGSASTQNKRRSGSMDSLGGGKII